MERAGQIPITKAARIVAGETKEKSRLVQRMLDEYSAVAVSQTTVSAVIQDPEKLCTGLLNHAEMMETVERFIRTVTGEPEQLGFKTSVLRLSSSKWLELYKDVKKLSGGKS